MLAGHPFGACLPTFGSCADRYCLSGYGGGGKTMEEMLDLARKVEGLDGLELVGNWHVNDQIVEKVGKMFKDRGLKVCMVTPDLWTQAKWGRGSFAAPDAATRKAGIAEIKKSMDWAAQLGCPYVDVWPGQDGFDYPFQADYVEADKWTKDALVECAAHQPKVRILVEYKPKEPRTHCFVSTVGRLLLLIHDLPNVGGLIDWGHALQSGENIAESVALMYAYGKLDYIHLNDNYRSWDDDMMVGSIHLVEYLELAYWLRRLGYKGYLTLDIFPYREQDKVAVAMQCKKWMEAFFRAVDRVGMDAFAKAIANADATATSELIRKAINI